MRKIIISGGPCSGKTSLCQKLKEKGLCSFGEIATKMLKKGTPKDWKEFNHNVFNKQIELEKKDKDIIFLDRSLVDSIVYMKYYNIDLPKDYKNKVKQANYEKVFFLEMLPKEHYIRKLPYEKAKEICRLTEQIYKEFKISLVKVPYQDTEKRVKFILDNI